jgi:hypothetical protein
MIFFVGMMKKDGQPATTDAFTAWYIDPANLNLRSVRGSYYALASSI